MKTLHFECSAGISGDMTLGALVDLGVNPDDLIRGLNKLGLEGWKLEFRRDERGGIGGIHAEVILEGQTDHIAHDDEHEHYHEHDHDHSHDDHDHDHHHEHHEHSHDAHDHEHHHEHDHHHNNWKAIRAMIEKADITAGAKKRALDIFTRIAEAEAQVHGMPVDEVAFHEVGALDSIIDIVGSAICLDLLQPDRITCGEVELGGGTVKCAHGILPVPAPATLLLVRGMPVKTGGFNKEMTTPTGAAILAASVDEYIGGASFREIKTGYGIGTRKMEKPNLLRVSWREEQALSAAQTQGQFRTEDLILMEASIDDMTGEALGFLMENLFEAGALDVNFIPCVMKKSRPGTIVSVLALPEKIDTLRRTLFEKSTTIGFREITVKRHSLDRENKTLRGSFGEARQKEVSLGGKVLRGKIEFEDRARLARERNISLEDAEKIILGEGKK
ncbi:UPF0272 protein [Spirochaetia bacterium]|nr:UPF0272 protein [Spirochaetia bacterium]